MFYSPMCPSAWYTEKSRKPFIYKGRTTNSAGARLNSFKQSSTKPSLKYKWQLSVGLYRKIMLYNIPLIILRHTALSVLLNH